MNKIKREDKVYFQNQIFDVDTIVSAKKIILKSSNGDYTEASLKDLQLISQTDSKIDLTLVPEKHWEEAIRKYNIIKPLINQKRTDAGTQIIADKNNVGIASVYRWLKVYEENQTLSSLLPTKRSGGKGKPRIDEESEIILNEVINNYFLTTEKRTVAQTFIEVKRKCLNANLVPPSEGTVRNRVLSLSQRKKIEKRLGQRAAQERFDPKLGGFPNADSALSVVQIDHTKLDIILQNPKTNQPIGRPWITVAIDVYSRMVVGYYLSFDAPSILNTGICISSSILPKEKLLAENDVDAQWPCWGIMNTIHVDNGKDFRSKAIERACMEYGINLEFRPIKKPEYGAHIERLLGTVIREIEAVPGKTFNKTTERRNYNSEKKAILTYDDLNKWLLIFFTKVYHNREHSQIGTSPYYLYNESILGSDNVRASGLPKMVKNTQKLYIDFLPVVERSIQNYGVVIDHIYYYSEILNNYIHSVEKEYVNSDKQIKKQFLFRRDPRDISKLFFYDEKTKTYYEIPYRDMSLPSISLWELRSTKKYLDERKIPIDERTIFEGINEMRQIENEATKYKRSFHRKKNKEYSERPPTSILTTEEINFEDLEPLKSDKTYDGK